MTKRDTHDVSGFAAIELKELLAIVIVPVVDFTDWN
jgi:hypothetical protein